MSIWSSREDRDSCSLLVPLKRRQKLPELDVLGLETGLATSSAVGGAKVTLVSTPKMGNIEQLTNARNGRGEGGGVPGLIS